MKRSESSATPARARLLAAFEREMRQASALGNLFSQAVAARIGANSSDLECLDFVILRGVCTAGQLAEATGLTTGAITGVIDRLERAGFARRERDTEDRRKVLVRALPAARRRIGPYYVSLQQALGVLLDRYSDSELALLVEFATQSGRIMADEIARLRRAAAAGTRRKASRKTTLA